MQPVTALLFKPIHFMKCPTTLQEATNTCFKTAYLLQSLPTPASSTQPRLFQIHFSLARTFKNLYHTKIINSRWRIPVYFFCKISSAYLVYFSFTKCREKKGNSHSVLCEVITDASSGSGKPYLSEDSPVSPWKYAHFVLQTLTLPKASRH